MAIYLSNRDGGKTDEQGHYKFQTNAFTGNVLDGGLLVTQDSPLAMNVKVSGGDARIPYSDYAYTAWIPAGSPETVTVTTANPSNPRIDRLVMYVDRGETPSSATANNPTLCKLMLVAGTPAGSPSRPSNGTVDTAVSNNPYIDLADILVGAGVTQITDADITDTRVLVGAPIADGSVTSTKLSTSANLLAITNITSTYNTGNTVAVTVLPGTSTTVTVPPGGRSVKVSFNCYDIVNNSAATSALTMFLRAAGTNIGGYRWRSLSAGAGTGASFWAIHTPAAGSVTYDLTFTKEVGGHGVAFNATATSPIQLLVELV